MSPITLLNYEYDQELLMQSVINAKKLSTNYSDPRYPNSTFDYWKIGHYTDSTIEKIMNDFEVEGKSRFYWLKPFAELPEHVDNGTQCSINFVLSDNAAPVTYSGKDYFYKQALINTSIPHSVNNGPEERVLFKISIFNKSYEELSREIRFNAS